MPRPSVGGSSWASGSGVSGVSGVALLGFAAALGSVAKVTKVARRATPSTPATPSTSRREVLRLSGAGAASAVMPQVALAKTKQEWNILEPSLKIRCSGQNVNEQLTHP